jgi:hypothetical protein
MQTQVDAQGVPKLADTSAPYVVWGSAIDGDKFESATNNGRKLGAPISELVREGKFKF